MNKIYILHQLSSDFMSENVIDFINSYVDTNLFLKNISFIDSQRRLTEEEFDQYLQQLIVSNLRELNKYILNEDMNDKLNFGENAKVIELYQILQILMKLKSKEWLIEMLIQTILFNEFIDSEKGSLKRIVIIYLVGVLTHYVLVSSNFQLDSVKNALSWIYSILDPQFNGNISFKLVDVITVYDRIAALSFLIELVKLDPSIFTIVRASVLNLTKQHDKELIPLDLKEKLIRAQVVDKLEFK
jgi:hypothetical protein